MDLQFSLTAEEHDNNVNGTDNTSVETPSPSTAYLTVISVSIVLGIGGNILVIGAVLVSKYLRTAGNTFIVNLALADLCVTAFVDPFSIVGGAVGRQWFLDRHALCEVIASICLTACFCSMLSIGAISFNRYIFICHNALYKRMFTFKKSLLMCVGLWTVSFLWELPNLTPWSDHVFDKKTMSCLWDRTAAFSYVLFFALVGVGFPVFLITVSYLKIFLKVRASGMKVGAFGANGTVQRSKAQREQINLARTLFIVFVVFVACWLPYAILIVLDFNDELAPEVHLYAITVAHINSSLNPILYGLTNRHFRAGYMTMLGIKTCGKTRVDNPRAAVNTVPTLQDLSGNRTDVTDSSKMTHGKQAGDNKKGSNMYLTPDAALKINK